MGSDLDGLVETAAAAAVETALMAGNSQREFCGNCGAKFTGQFCSQCGQERDTHRRSVYGLLHDLIEDVLSFDSRILRTARALVLHPGELSSAFREGRVRRYVPPVRLYFFATLLFFVTLSLTGVALMRLEIVNRTLTPAERAAISERFMMAAGKSKASVAKADAQPTKSGMIGPVSRRGAGTADVNIVDTKGDLIFPALKTQFFVPSGAPPPKLSAETKAFLAKTRARLKKIEADMAAKGNGHGILNWMVAHVQNATLVLERNPDAVNGPLMTWIPRALFLLLPTFALLLALFHIGKRQDFYFVDHLIFSLNLHSFAFVVLTLVVVVARFDTSARLGWLALAAVGIYMLLAMKRFYRQGWFITAFKFVWLAFIYSTFILIPALFVVVTVSALES